MKVTVASAMFRLLRSRSFSGFSAIFGSPGGARFHQTFLLSFFLFILCILFQGFFCSPAQALEVRYIRLVYSNFNDTGWFQLNEIEVFKGSSSPVQAAISSIQSTQAPYPGFDVARLKDGLKSYNGDFVVQRPVAPLTINIDMGGTIEFNSIIHWNDGQYGAKAVRVETSPDGNGYTLYSDFSLTVTAGQPNADTLSLTQPVYSVSGYIKSQTGTGVDGITVEVSGNPVVYSNTSGLFTRSGLAPGTYTVTPKSSSFTFVPATTSITVPPNASALSFTATPVQSGFRLAGYVKTASGSGVEGVALSLAAGTTVLTDQDGRYEMASLSAGSYTVTPGRGGYTFDPAVRNVVLGPDALSENFTAAPGTSTNTVAARFVRLKYQNFNDSSWFQLNEIEVFGREPGGLSVKLPPQSIQVSKTPFSGYGSDKLTDGQKILNGDFAVKSPGTLIEITMDLGADKVLDKIIHYNDGSYGAPSVEILRATSTAPSTFERVGVYTGLGSVSGQVNQNELSFNSSVVINEFTLNGDASTIELFNSGTSSIDLTGWKVDFSGSVFTFDPISIPAQGFLVLHEGSGSTYGNDVYTRLNWPVESAGGFIEVFNTWNGGIDFLRWGDSSENPSEGNYWYGVNPDSPEDGESISRSSDGFDSDSGQDWALMTPTPGAANISFYTISGTAQLDGSGLAGVNINVSGFGNRTADGSGQYTVSSVPAGTYTLTPSLAGYAFNPTSMSLSLGPDAVGKNFTASVDEGAVDRFTFSGYLKDAQGGALGSVELSIAGIGKIFTDQTGRYVSALLPPGIYRVTPSSGEYGFTPVFKDIAIGPSVTNQNFTGTEVYKISGYLISSVSGPLSGARVLINETTEVVTDANGYYEKGGLIPGQYRVRPSVTGFVFEPLEKMVTLPPSVQHVDFDFTQSFLISGHVMNEQSQPVAGASVEILSSGIRVNTVLTGADGQWEIADLDSGQYTIKCSKTGFVVDSPQRTASVPPSVTGMDFTARQVFSMSGYVKTAGGVPINGCSVELEGVGQVLTDATGYWSRQGLFGGTYQVIPKKEFYLFTPQARTITLGPDTANNNFEGTYVASGSLIYVNKKVASASPDGSREKPYQSITQAINAISLAGASIEVAAGIYFENPVLKPNVSVRGEGAAVTIIEGSGQGTVVTMGDNTALVGVTVKGSGLNAGNCGVDFTKVNSYATAAVYNCLIRDNREGVRVDDISPRIENNTIFDNDNADLVLVGSTSPRVWNSIIGIIDNQSPSSNIPQVGYCCLPMDLDAFPGNGNIEGDPLFVDPDGGIYFLAEGSPCIDAGDPADIYRDIDSSRSDIGAFGGPRAGLLSAFLLVTSLTSDKPGFPGYSVDNVIDGSVTVNGDFAVRNAGTRVELTFDLGADRVVNRIVHYNDSSYGAKRVKVSYAKAESPTSYTTVMTSDILGSTPGVTNRDILTMEPLVARYFRLTYEEFFDLSWFQLNEVEFYGWGGRPDSEQIPIVTVESSKTAWPGYGTDKLKDGKVALYTDFALKNHNNSLSLSFDLGSDRKVEKIIHYNDGQYGATRVKIYYGHTGFPIEWQVLGTFESLTNTANRTNMDVLTFSPVSARHFKLEYLQFGDPLWIQLNEVEFWGVSESSGMYRINGSTTPLTASVTAFAGYGIEKLQDGAKIFNGDFAAKLPVGESQIILNMDLGQEFDVEQVRLYNDGQYGAQKLFLQYSTQKDPDVFIGVSSWENLPIQADQVNRAILTFASVRGRHLRFTLSQPGNPSWMQLNELEVYGGTIETVSATAYAASAASVPFYPQGTVACTVADSGVAPVTCYGFSSSHSVRGESSSVPLTRRLESSDWTALKGAILWIPPGLPLRTAKASAGAILPDNMETVAPEALAVPERFWPLAICPGDSDALLGAVCSLSPRYILAVNISDDWLNRDEISIIRQGIAASGGIFSVLNKPCSASSPSIEELISDIQEKESAKVARMESVNTNEDMFESHAFVAEESPVPGTVGYLSLPGVSGCTVADGASAFLGRDTWRVMLPNSDSGRGFFRLRLVESTGVTGFATLESASPWPFQAAEILGLHSDELSAECSQSLEFLAQISRGGVFACHRDVLAGHLLVLARASSQATGTLRRRMGGLIMWGLALLEKVNP